MKEEAHHGHHDHQSPIRTPKQLIVTVVLAFAIPIVVIGLLAKFVTYAPVAGEGSSAMTPEAINARIAPVAQLVLVDSNAPKVFKAGEAVYTETCTTCHGTGIAGAPKFGDAAMWEPRIKQSAATLFEHAIKGFTGKAGVMPAKGGNTDLDDIEVQRAVVYMANGSGGKLKEPEAPAAAAAKTADASGELSKDAPPTAPIVGGGAPAAPAVAAAK
jgi:cytochrome c5